MTAAALRAPLRLCRTAGLPAGTTRIGRRALAALLSILVFPAVFSSRAAWADPHALPFSYPTATLPGGLSEVEQYVDLSPVRATDASGTALTTLSSVLVTELEYGLTDRLELGLYMVFFTDPAATAGGSQLHFDGIKQRLRYRFADPGVWPVNLGVYGEIAEFSDEIELEAKVLLDRRVGRWQFIANLWAERAFHYSGQREWVANPTAGASFQIVPAFHVGVEYWMHGEFGSNQPAAAPSDFNAQAHHYVGPAFLLQASRVWWAVAPYVRVDDWGRAGQPGDQFGRFWIRSIIGVDL